MPASLRRLRLPLVVVTALFAVAACVPRPDFRPPIGPRAALGHAGRWLTDRDGRVVNLRGVNFVQKFPPVGPATAGFDEADARFLHDEGFDVVRLGVVLAR